jgi:hypothetical protein
LGVWKGVGEEERLDDVYAGGWIVVQEERANKTMCSGCSEVKG